MLKGALATLAVVILIAAAFAVPDVVRAQAPTTQFEYLQVTPFGVSFPVASNQVHFRVGYRACAAATTEWSCREFRPAAVSDSALRSVLATLGSEGWDLVSAVKEEGPTSGLTYLFKRPAR